MSAARGSWSAFDVLSAWMFSYFLASGVEDFGRYAGWVTKCPERGRCIAAYTAAFPSCRIIHMTRDPRGFYLSYISDQASALKRGKLRAHRRFISRIASLFELVREYRASHRNGRRAAAASGGNVSIVRYEDLVADTEATMNRLAGFLGIRLDDRLLRPTLRDRPCPAGFNSSFEPGPGSEGRVFDDSVWRWRRALPWHERKLIEFGLAAELAEAGYEAGGAAPGLKRLLWECLESLRARA